MTENDRRRVPDLVWYAGYGSNLCAERFLCYIAGGIPPGLTRRCRGARDTTHPRDDRPLDISHRLYFAGFAEPWAGAPCFLDSVESPDAPTHARAYLITWEQFEDVAAQENGRATSPIDLDLDLAFSDRTTAFGTRLGPGRYQNLLCFGSHDDGFPVVTITSPWAMSDAQLGAPSTAYLKVMISGLRQSHAMSDDAIVAYLAGAPGCSEQLVLSAFAPSNQSDAEL